MTAIGEMWFDCFSSNSDNEEDSVLSEESEHNELDEEFEMNAELGDPETGYLLGKAHIGNKLW